MQACLHRNIFMHLYGAKPSWAKWKPWKGDFANVTLNSYIYEHLWRIKKLASKISLRRVTFYPRYHSNCVHNTSRRLHQVFCLNATSRESSTRNMLWGFRLRRDNHLDTWLSSHTNRWLSENQHFRVFFVIAFHKIKNSTLRICCQLFF